MKQLTFLVDHVDLNKVGCKLGIQYISCMACCGKVHVCMQTFPNSHIFLQLSADVLRRMRESEQPGNTKSPSSLPDNQKDPSSELQAESLLVLQRSIWQPLCKCYFHCSYKKKPHSEHEIQHSI